MLTIFLSFKILDSLCLHVFKKKHHNIMQADHHETATPRPFILSVPSLHKGNKGPVKITFFAGPPLAASRNLKAMALSYNWSISHIPRESQTTKPHRLCLPHLDPKACIFPHSFQGRLVHAGWVWTIGNLICQCWKRVLPSKASESLLVGLFKPK